MKLLVISLAGNGDTLFATPLIHELRANFPAAQIDVLVRWRAAQELLDGNPHVNTVHQRDLMSAGKIESLKFLRQLRRERYDISFNTHPQSRIHYRLISRIVAARLRASHEYECSGPLDKLLVNRSLPQDYTRHAIHNNLALLGLVGAKPVLPRHDYEIFPTPRRNGNCGAILRRKKTPRSRAARRSHRFRRHQESRAPPVAAGKLPGFVSPVAGNAARTFHSPVRRAGRKG